MGTIKVVFTDKDGGKIETAFFYDSKSYAEQQFSAFLDMCDYCADNSNIERTDKLQKAFKKYNLSNGHGLDPDAEEWDPQS